MTDDVDDFLAHYGVKGMKWGVRKEEFTSSARDRVQQIRDIPDNMTPEQKKRAKQVAIGAGILIASAGAAYLGHQMHTNGAKSMADLASEVTPAMKAATEKLVRQEPTTLIHATRGNNRGFRFLKDGSIPNYMTEYDEAFGKDSTVMNDFKRYGANKEKLAVSFMDPEGRKDRSTRLIPHQVIVPASMAKGIENMDDFMSKVWPMIKDEYKSFYDEEDL